MRDTDNFSPVLTRADVCRTFKQDMKSLYLLSLLLTAGRHSAEECFVSSLDDCLNMRPVFREWAQSWTRRVVLENAIRTLRPAAHNEDATPQSQVNSPAPELSPALCAILRLGTFERFVLVMSVLEGYSDHECSLLLRAKRRDVVAAKAKALGRLGQTSKRKEFLRPALQVEHQFAAMENE